MIIYVETNFLLELTFGQSEATFCNEIMELCRIGKATLAIPAYSFVEPNEKLIRQAMQRKKLQNDINTEISQISRSTENQAHLPSMKQTSSLFVKISEEDRKRFMQYKTELVEIAEVIPLSKSVLEEAFQYEEKNTLGPQDSVVYASICEHLENNRPEVSCFLNKNKKDFDDPDIVETLKNLNCTYISRFENGLRFVSSYLSSTSIEN